MILPIKHNDNNFFVSVVLQNIIKLSQNTEYKMLHYYSKPTPIVEITKKRVS